MLDTELDESRVYREYFELLQRFNSAEDRYVASLNEASRRKQAAIERAFEKHVEPLRAKLRQVQVIGVFFFVVALLLMCVLGEQKSFGVGFLILFLVAAAGMAAAIWSTQRISTLVSDSRYYRDNPPTSRR